MAVVVLDEKEFASWASSNGISGSFEEQSRNPKVGEIWLFSSAAVCDTIVSSCVQLQTSAVIQTSQEQLDSTKQRCERVLGTGSGASVQPGAWTQAAQLVCEELNKEGKKGNLRGFERVKAVHLDVEQWSVDNGLMTPSFKLKRNQLQKHYQKDIDCMYAEAKKSS